MYANKEDLYKAKCDYYEKQLEEVLSLLTICHQQSCGNNYWVLVDRINNTISEIEDTLSGTY
jgi:hypothetical protein